MLWLALLRMLTTVCLLAAVRGRACRGPPGIYIIVCFGQSFVSEAAPVNRGRFIGTGNNEISLVRNLRLASMPSCTGSAAVDPIAWYHSARAQTVLSGRSGTVTSIAVDVGFV